MRLIQSLQSDKRLLRAFDFERELNVSSRGVAVGADRVVCLLHQRARFVDWQRWYLHMHHHGDAEATTFARPYRSRASHDRSGDVLLVLVREEFDCPTETCCITSSKQMLRCRGIGQTWAAHFL